MRFLVYTTDFDQKNNWENTPTVVLPLHLFEDVEDQRVERRKLHELSDILAISLCATMAGADGWEDMENFGKSKAVWLRTWLPIPNGIPSDDTFRRVISAIDPNQLSKTLDKLGKWMQDQLAINTQEDDLSENDKIEQANQKQIAIDGKCLRAATDEDHKRGNLYMLNAWSTDQGIALGQCKVNGKSNEITAIPELLELISIKNCIVTIDAAGAQKKIASKIINQGGDYVLALKGNQGSLHDEVCNYFEQAIDIFDKAKIVDEGVKELQSIGISMHTTDEEGHGRKEKRELFLATDLAWLPMLEKWEGLKSVSMIRSTRICKGKESIENRFYISSLDESPQKIGECIRGHWGIENSLHWVLDVAFNEDDISISEGNAAANLSVLRSISLSLLKNSKHKGGVKAKRKRAGWDTDFLEEVLLSSNF